MSPMSLSPAPIQIFNAATNQVQDIDTPRYPDGMPMVKDLNQPDTIMLRSPHIGQLMAVLWWVDALRDRGHQVQRLILPLVPGVRQDRLQPGGGDQLFTLKSVANEINMREFESVVILDPHSDVAPALIERCEVVTAADCLSFPNDNHKGYDCVIVPDAGALKRASLVATMYGVPLVHAWKHRDQKTGALSGFGCEYLPPNTKRALIVDDLCDGGGTFIGLAEHIKTSFPKAILDLYVTHGLFTQGYGKLLNYFKRVITTDSAVPRLPLPAGLTKEVIVLPVCESMLKP